MTDSPSQLSQTPKVGVVMGVANQHSIATGIAKVISAQGADLAFSYLPDTTGKMLTRVKKALADIPSKLIAPCDVGDDESIARFFAEVQSTYGNIDFLVHSIAFAAIDDLRKSTIETSRSGFLKAMEISVYSFLACTHRASQFMNAGGSVITLTYYGGEKVVPGYNVMGVAKSALDSAVRYASYELGSKGIRVNGLSSGAIKTLASSAVGASKMIKQVADIAPLPQPLTQQSVGEVAAFLISDAASSITGEILHVDGGYHVMGYYSKS